MSRFSSKQDDKVIQAEWWDEDETVTIKKFNYGDRQYLAKMMVSDLRMDDQGQPLFELNIGEMNLVILERGIRSWTLKGPKGKVSVCSRTWMERLSERDAEFILAEINAYNPRRRRSAEEQKGFRGGSGGSDQE